MRQLGKVLQMGKQRHTGSDPVGTGSTSLDTPGSIVAGRWFCHLINTQEGWPPIGSGADLSINSWKRIDSGKTGFSSAFYWIVQSRWLRFNLLVLWGTMHPIQRPTMEREQHAEIGSPDYGLLLSCRILEHILENGWGWCLHTWVVSFAGLQLWLPAREAHFSAGKEGGLRWLLPSSLASLSLEKDWVSLLLVK